MRARAFEVYSLVRFLVVIFGEEDDEGMICLDPIATVNNVENLYSK